MTNPREIADILNRMKPGQTKNFTEHELTDIEGSLNRTGWQVVLDNVFGSDHVDIWSFQFDEFQRIMRVTRWKE